MRDIVVASSVLIAVVLLIRYLAKGRLNPLLQYALWLPVVLRLVIPVPLWSSSFSVMNLFPDQTVEGIADRMDSGDENATEGNAAGIFHGAGILAGMSVLEKTGNFMEMAVLDNAEKSMGTGALRSVENPSGIGVLSDAGNPAGASILDNNGNLTGTDALDSTGNFERNGASDYNGNFAVAGALIRLIWAAGVLLTGGYMLFYQIRWKRYLSANRRPLTGREKYRDKLFVYTVKNLPSPCLSGRCIYLTKEMAGDAKQLEHILAHEYCHYKHLDSLWVIVRCTLTAFYWFHPLVWVAARVSKQDSELACDAAAIRLLGETERLAYGKTLLGLIIGDGCDRSRIGIASTMSGGEKGIRERILRIAGTPRYVAATAGIVLLVVVAAVAVTFSGKKEALKILQEQQDTLQEQKLQQPDTLQGQELQQQQEMLQEQEQEVQRLKQELEAEVEAAKKAETEAEATRRAVQEAEKTAIEEVERERAVLEKLASYDADIEETGSRAGVFAVRDALNPGDYVQAYYEKREAALEEGMYLLEVHKGPDSSDIKVYGMYSKEYGCEGIKILIGDDVNDFDEKWLVSGLHGMEADIRLYESAKDGMPRTFACRAVIANTSDTEIWNLYLCDRYDTGTIELCAVRPEEVIGELTKRMRFEINVEECAVDVYDRGKLVGQVPVNASPEAMKSVQEVVIDGSGVSWELGDSEKEIRMMTAIGLKVNATEAGETELSGTESKGMETVWYHRLPLLSFPVTCGNFGERKIQFGQASVDTEFVNGMHQFGAESLDQFLELTEESVLTEGNGTEAEFVNVMRQDGTDILSSAFQEDSAHYDVEIAYCNPCPSYTRISDTFGTRTNPITGEKKLHTGIDLAAEEGADIVAAAEGTVYQTGFDAVYGNYVVLYHVLSGEFTYYTSCQDVLVKEGSSVAAGQKIATVGSTGTSTGPHLHFALSRNGEYVEPVFEQE